jgi:hypothetical protein
MAGTRVDDSGPSAFAVGVELIAAHCAFPALGVLYLGMSCPLPINWWHLGVHEVFFENPNELPVFFVGEDFEISRAHRNNKLVLPLFQPAVSRGFIHNHLQEHIKSLLVEAGSYWTSGRFYGVLRTEFYGVDRTREGSLEYGLALALGHLTPEVQGSGSPSELSLEGCRSFHLPTWTEAYQGPRPSRFEREWVI